jgi:peptidyl-prolyl cis-trans isomerase A (cyclophilin A)
MKVLAVVLMAVLAACSKPEAAKAPDTFKVRFTTSKGAFVVEAHKSWAPRGIDRFYELLTKHHFDEGRFFRVVPGFIAQFGVHKDYDTHKFWRKLAIGDDKRTHDNKRGTLSFAHSGPNTRTTEMFVNLADNKMLDEQDFVPFAEVVEGMQVVDSFYSGYGEMRPVGKYINPGRVEEGANSYLARFPNLDYIIKTEILP